MLAESSRVTAFRGHSRDVVLCAFSASLVIRPNLRALLLGACLIYLFRSHLLS